MICNGVVEIEFFNVDDQVLSISGLEDNIPMDFCGGEV